MRIYGRTVAEVISDININLVLVEDGQAFAYWRDPGSCEAREYRDAEYRASRHRYGCGSCQVASSVPGISAAAAVQGD
jgi:endonuclease YncB( thermonuclease family)